MAAAGHWLQHLLLVLQANSDCQTQQQRLQRQAAVAGRALTMRKKSAAHQGASGGVLLAAHIPLTAAEAAAMAVPAPPPAAVTAAGTGQLLQSLLLRLLLRVWIRSCLLL